MANFNKPVTAAATATGGSETTGFEGEAGWQAQHDDRSGGEAAPFLDKGGGNVPETTRPVWSKKQWMTRRAVMDRLRFWQSNDFQCLWVTLTSSPTSPDKRLRQDYQTLRKRIKRELGFEHFQYICVDTREGFGVLHMVWAWHDPNQKKRGSFYIPFEWLQKNWQDIHGAFHVNVKRIGGQDKDARRLARYIVAQYCGDQYGLVRLSQSKLEIPLTRMRQVLLSTLKRMPERYSIANQFADGFTPEELSSVLNQWLFITFKRAWDDLVRERSCKAFGVRFVWWNGNLERV